MNMTVRNALFIWLLMLSHGVCAATFVVNSIWDTPDTNPGDGICEATSGGVQCTLRAAIEEANATPEHDLINFSFGGFTISITGSELPPIRTSMTINGGSAPTYNSAASDTRNAPPGVYIDGHLLTRSDAEGLDIRAGSAVQIYALGITGFPGKGININSGLSGVVIDSNWIGVSRGGAKAGNGADGIYARINDSAIGQTIFRRKPPLSGYVIKGRGNIVSNNDGDGIVVWGSNNTISGNHIGAPPSGTLSSGNMGYGIQMLGSDNKIGDINEAAGLATGNQVGNNKLAGINDLGVRTTILANHIFFNTSHGIMSTSSNSVIGNSSSLSRNVIETNGGDGIFMTWDAYGTKVENSWIFGNYGRGIYVQSTVAVTLRKNSIWSNFNDAIRLESEQSTVVGNELGIQNGVLKGNAANGLVIQGNSNSVSGNVIGGLADDGIDLVSGRDNEIFDNRIGTNAALADWGNQAAGIRIRSGAQRTRIENNDIGNNRSSGIREEGASFTNIDSNRIGSSPTGQNMGNGISGLVVYAGSEHLRVQGNVIGRSYYNGILLEANNARICGNSIGMTNSYYAGNGINGIWIKGNNNRIGGLNNSCSPNTIAGNSSNGIQVEGDSNIIQDNFLGGNQAVGWGNSQNGVLLMAGATNNRILANYIRANGTDGVGVKSDAGTGNAIRGNYFSFNDELAIDLELDGITQNDAGDPDSGVNNLQNYPLVESVSASGPNELRVQYRMDSEVSNAQYPITVEFYVSNVDDGQGYYTHISSSVDGPNTSEVSSFDPGIPTGFLTTLAIDAGGNTSELSGPVAFNLNHIGDDIFSDSFE